MKKELYMFFEKLSPAEISKIMGKRQDNSTRDKKLLLKRILEIENFLDKKNMKITVKKNE